MEETATEAGTEPTLPKMVPGGHTGSPHEGSGTGRPPGTFLFPPSP